MSAILIRLEGVLADCEPGDTLPGVQPHLDIKKFYAVLKEGFEIVVSSATNREHATFWLRSNGYGDITSLYTDGTLTEHIQISRQFDDPDLVIATPDEGVGGLIEGLPVLAWTRPIFGRRDFRPDLGPGFRPWAQIQDELDQQHALVPPEPDARDGRYER